MFTTRYQKGVAITELKIALTCSLLLSVVLYVAVIRPLLNLADANSIESTVYAVQEAAGRYYGKDISLSRCFNPTNSLSINNLVSDKFLSPDFVTGKNFQISVNYVLQNNGSWSRASQTTVTLTFPSSYELNRLVGYLDALQLSSTQLLFTQPIVFDVDWRSFTPQTGCIN